MTKKEFWNRVHKELAEKTGYSVKSIQSVRSCSLGDKWTRAKIYDYFSKKYTLTKSSARAPYYKEAMAICVSPEDWKTITDNSYKYMEFSG